MDLDWSQTHAAGVTLVSVRVRNDTGIDRRVRLQNRLRGPVLPPRTEGVPEAGWNRNGVSVRVPSGETVALGYACPAGESDGDRSADPPVRLADVGPASKTPPAPTGTIRRLGDPRPPRTVVDPDEGGPEETAPGTEQTAPDTEVVETRTEQAATGPEQTTTDLDETRTDTPSTTTGDTDRSARPAGPEESLPPAVEVWLTDVRTRLESASELEDASVSEAATILEAGDGVAGVARLADDLETDERALRRVAEVATALADRAAADPPSDALRRLS